MIAVFLGAAQGNEKQRSKSSVRYAHTTQKNKTVWAHSAHTRISMLMLICVFNRPCSTTE